MRNINPKWMRWSVKANLNGAGNYGAATQESEPGKSHGAKGRLGEREEEAEQGDHFADDEHFARIEDIEERRHEAANDAGNFSQADHIKEGRCWHVQRGWAKANVTCVNMREFERATRMRTCEKNGVNLADSNRAVHQKLEQHAKERCRMRPLSCHGLIAVYFVSVTKTCKNRLHVAHRTLIKLERKVTKSVLLALLLFTTIVFDASLWSCVDLFDVHLCRYERQMIVSSYFVWIFEFPFLYIWNFVWHSRLWNRSRCGRLHPAHWVRAARNRLLVKIPFFALKFIEYHHESAVMNAKLNQRILDTICIVSLFTSCWCAHSLAFWLDCHKVSCIFVFCLQCMTCMHRLSMNCLYFRDGFFNCN